MQTTRIPEANYEQRISMGEQGLQKESTFSGWGEGV